jgi:hypothetical protein
VVQGREIEARKIIKGNLATDKNHNVTGLISRTTSVMFAREHKREAFMMRDEDNYVSVGQWMLLLLVPAIPVVGWILIIILAFTGSNESRKNYFRAMIAWFVLAVVFLVVLGLILVAFPALFQDVKNWQANHHY